MNRENDREPENADERSEFVHVWLTADDERVCWICGPLHKAPQYVWEIEFPEGPPAHPNCRCRVQQFVKGQEPKRELITLLDLSPEVEGGDSMTSRPERLSTRASELLQRDHTLNGGILYGLEGFVVEIQARAISVLRKPAPIADCVRISGMARGAIGESLDRIRGVFAKLEIGPSPVRILVNLAPAGLPKDGTWLDLPLAIILLQAAGYVPDLPDHQEGDYILAGELGLHGEIRRIPGALSIAFAAKPGQTVVVPCGNEKECALILAKPGHEDCRVASVSTLDEVIAFFRGEGKLDNALREQIEFESVVPKAVDFGQIKGQEKAKEAAIIAAAGGHNLLLIGPPGEGKTLLASALPGILPKLSRAEQVELTKLYSACGKLERDGMAVSRRPMRVIHHSASPTSLVGGGSGIPRPGEITLAHHGVLFLDELPEFSGHTLEALRQPMESGEISISRVGGTLTFPCRFTLVAAMNPCPCGWFGTDQCECSERDVQKYQQKISGPILDRIDLQVELARLSTEERFANQVGEESPAIRAQVQAAREIQSVRYKGTDIPHNAAMPGGDLKEYCQFSPGGFDHYRQIVDGNQVSTRSSDRLAKVARTVADLVGKTQIEPAHLDKAASFVIGGMLRDGL